MSVADLQELEEVKGLITRGLQIGVLTYAEIMAAIAELGLEETDVEELHGLFERCEIELVEEIDPATAAGLNIERAPENPVGECLRRDQSHRSRCSRRPGEPRPPFPVWGSWMTSSALPVCHRRRVSPTLSSSLRYARFSPRTSARYALPPRSMARSFPDAASRTGRHNSQARSPTPRLNQPPSVDERLGRGGV